MYAYTSKKVMDDNFFENTAEVRSFLRAYIFSLKCDAVVLNLCGAVALKLSGAVLRWRKCHGAKIIAVKTVMRWRKD